MVSGAYDALLITCALASRLSFDNNRNVDDSNDINGSFLHC